MGFLKKLGSLFGISRGTATKTRPRFGSTVDRTLDESRDLAARLRLERDKEAIEARQRRRREQEAEIERLIKKRKRIQEQEDISDRLSTQQEIAEIEREFEKEFKKRREAYRKLPAEEQYIRGDMWVEAVGSSNVGSFAYDPAKSTLLIIFKDGNEYHYLNVSKEEALSLYRARSKGKWVWDHLRIRKTRLGHKKQYVHVAGHTAIKRKWIETEESMTAHLRQVGKQSREKGHNIFGVIPESVPDTHFLVAPIRGAGEPWLKERVGPSGGPFGRK